MCLLFHNIGWILSFQVMYNGSDELSLATDNTVLVSRMNSLSVIIPRRDLLIEHKYKESNLIVVSEIETWLVAYT